MTLRNDPTVLGQGQGRAGKPNLQDRISKAQKIPVRWLRTGQGRKPQLNSGGKQMFSMAVFLETHQNLS